MAKDKTSQRWIDYFQNNSCVEERAIISARARITNGPATPLRTSIEPEAYQQHPVEAVNA